MASGEESHLHRKSGKEGHLAKCTFISTGNKTGWLSGLDYILDLLQLANKGLKILIVNIINQFWHPKAHSAYFLTPLIINHPKITTLSDFLKIKKKKKERKSQKKR